MTFTLTRDEQFIRVVASGDTFPAKDQLKQLGFKWSNSAWREMKLASDDEIGAAADWLMWVVRTFPQAEWQGPAWALEWIAQERRGVAAR